MIVSVERENPSIVLKIKKIIKKILKISIPKTLYFNIHYFGVKGLILPVYIGKKVELRHLKGKIRCENFKSGVVQIGMNEMGNYPYGSTYSLFKNNGEIVFKGNALLGIGTCITNRGIITFGDNFTITANSSIICRESITFGDNVLISWNVEFMDTDLHKIYDIDSKELLNPDKYINIGNNVWICNNVFIGKGVSIPSNNIIANHSSIKKTITAEHSIIGNSGKIIKQSIFWTS